MALYHQSNTNISVGHFITSEAEVQICAFFRHHQLPDVQLRAETFASTMQVQYIVSLLSHAHSTDPPLSVETANKHPSSPPRRLSLLLNPRSLSLILIFIAHPSPAAFTIPSLTRGSTLHFPIHGGAPALLLFQHAFPIPRLAFEGVRVFFGFRGCCFFGWCMRTAVTITVGVFFFAFAFLASRAVVRGLGCGRCGAVTARAFSVTMSAFAVLVVAAGPVFAGYVAAIAVTSVDAVGHGWRSVVS